MKLTLEKLKEMLHYNPETGVFTWLSPARNKRYAGKVAGTVNANGHVLIRCMHVSYMAHRLAWFYMTGCWPDGEIDHINVKPADNRWCNLRECSRQENEMNKGLRKDNTSGFKGVDWHKATKKWRVKVKVSGKYAFCKYFHDLELADLAAREARDKFHKEFSRHS